MMPSEVVLDVGAAVRDSNSLSEGLLAESRKTCTVPSGRFVEPDLVLVWGINVASAGPTRVINRCMGCTRAV